MEKSPLLASAAIGFLGLFVPLKSFASETEDRPAPPPAAVMTSPLISTGTPPIGPRELPEVCLMAGVTCAQSGRVFCLVTCQTAGPPADLAVCWWICDH
ncbi:hypothetical protein O7A70_06125 [Mesorhizobium sp. Cs1299R1N1]|uniref:hypothetical protein n=1 Tax=unclassified Mesorhizobium TaxID=325217 RepID=UPI00301D1EBD